MWLVLIAIGLFYLLQKQIGNDSPQFSVFYELLFLEDIEKFWGFFSLK